MDDRNSGFLALLGARVADSGDGRARVELEATEQHLNPAGTVHGGVLATLVDAAMGAAIGSTTDDAVPATSQLTVTYLRPGTPGLLVVTAEVRKQGESLTVCEAAVEQDGKAVVHALATFALLG